MTAAIRVNMDTLGYGLVMVVANRNHSNLTERVGFRKPFLFRGQVTSTGYRYPEEPVNLQSLSSVLSPK
jgi:hypothetical protein